MEENKEQELQEQSDSDFSLKDLFVVFARSWWIILIVMALVFGVFYGMERSSYVPRYTASAKVYITRYSDTVQTSQVSISNALVPDYMESIYFSNVLDLVRTDCLADPNQLSDQSLSGMISASNADSSRIVVLSVTAEDKEMAVRLVDSLARQSVNYFNQELVREQYAQYVDKVDSSTPDRYVSLANPFSYNKALVFGLGAGILVYLFFFLLHILDNRINSAEDVEKQLGLNLLGEIPYRRSGSKGPKYAAEVSGAKGDGV